MRVLSARWGIGLDLTGHSLPIDTRTLAGEPADRTWLVCLLLVAVEAVIVLGVVGMGGHKILGGDGWSYERYARNLVDHFVYSDSATAPLRSSVFRTPGYPLFLALFQFLAPGSLLVGRIAQFALLGVTAFLVYRVALFVTSRRGATVSAVLCVTFLPFVWLAAYQLTEILATFLAVAVILLVFHARIQGAGVSQFVKYGALGVTIGLLALVRPEDGLVVVPLAVALFFEGRDVPRPARFREPAILLAGFVLVLAPWTIRGEAVGHAFIPLGTDAGQNLYASSQQYAGSLSYAGTAADYRRLYGPNGWFAQISGHPFPTAAPIGGARVEVASNNEFVSAAWRSFGTLGASQIIHSLPARLSHLWGTADFPPKGRFATAIHWVAVVQWGLLLMLSGLGILLTAARHQLRRCWPLLVFPVYTTLVHLVFIAGARYSVPDRPFLIIFAAISLVWLADLAFPQQALLDPAASLSTVK